MDAFNIDDATMNEKIQQIWDWFESGKISHNDLKQAFTVSESQTTASAWTVFVIKLLLSLSLAALVCGIIFFFAYNWDDMSRSHKFLLLQSLIVINTLGVFISSQKSFLQHSLAFSLMMMVGALFAFYGQTYQTGKDPWELFFNWFLITLPVTVIVRKNAHWLLSMILLNLSLMLYLNVHSGIWGFFYNESWQVFILACVNFAFAEVFAKIFQPRHWVENDLMMQLTLIASLFGFSLLSLYFIFESYKHPLHLISYLAIMAWIFFQYRVKSANLIILSAWTLSGIAFIVSLFIRLIEDDFNGGSFLFITLLITGLSAVAGNWLIKLNKEAQQGEDHESN